MPKDHFWLRLHQLAQAFEAQGTTDVERTWKAKADLAQMPPELQQETLSRVAKMSAILAIIADRK